MRIIPMPTLLFLLCLLSMPIERTSGQILSSDLTDSDSENPEAIANKTYAQEQSELQRAIFRNYERKVRPVRNQSQPITVLFHAYLMHFSVDQLQQTIFLNGHIYLTWIDEMATWEPADFNNVRTTIVKNWELWQPELRIANSVSGSNQYFEISRKSHATLIYLGPNKTKVETYPTFTARIGCSFDFSDYPFDEQSCAARLYTTNVMSEVELAIYYNLDPSVLLSWGNQSSKRHVQDWKLLAVQANMSYYKSQRKYSDERPSSAYEAQSTWTLILLGVRLSRSAPQYWMGLGLPCLASLLLLLLSFLTTKPEHSIGLVLGNFCFQVVILRALHSTLPPATGTKPRIVQFSQLLLFATLSSLALHVLSRRISQRLSQVPFLQKLLLTGHHDDKQDEQHPSGSPQPLRWIMISPLLFLRICCLLILLFCSIPITLLLIL